MNISIFGLGYVGAVSLACLARDFHHVIGVDVEPSKLALIREGKSPIVEEGIRELMQEVVASGRVTVTDKADEAIAHSDVSFVCVGTPPATNGSQDLSAIKRLAGQIGTALRNKSTHHLIVIRSTVKPGTVEKIIQPLIEEHSGRRAGQHFSICFQPEFLREGTSIKDYDHPPFTVVGASDDRAIETLRTLFGHLPGEFVHTSIRTAEMLKYACNAFHALKVSFANEIGRISQALEVDPHEVMRMVCMDRQLNISPAYLKPGFAFGGSCLPKDLRALLYLARSHDVELPMLANILPSNRLHIDHAIELALGNGGRRSIGMVGLSFKSGTDDLRESPLVSLAEHFIGKGCRLRIFDPEVSLSRLVGANKIFIEETIPHIASLMSDNLSSVIRESEVLIVGLKTPAVIEALETHSQKDQLLVDLAALPQPLNCQAQYQGLCW